MPSSAVVTDSNVVTCVWSVCAGYSLNSLSVFCSVQSTAMAYDEVTENAVYLCTGQPLPSDIAQIVEWMLNEDFSTAYKSECVRPQCTQ